MRIIDLHIHSTFSDGSMTPRDIIKAASQKNIAALAITDHDTVEGIDEAESAAKEYDIELLTGMEITTEYKTRKLHIVALGFDRRNRTFKEFYDEIRSVREARIGEIINGIADMGIDISLEKVKAITSGSIDRYAIVRYLLGLRLENRAQTLWDKYIHPVVKQLNLTIDIPAEKAIKAIHAAGGILSLAHFHKRIGLQGFSRDEQEKILQELRSLGLDGIEQWYPTFSDEDSEFVREMTEKYGFINTGGTDFHGKNRPGIELGTGLDNNMAIPYEVFEGIKNRLKV